MRIDWLVRLHRRRMQKMLDAYTTGDLLPAEQRQVEQHLDSCDACRTTLERLAATDHALAAARPEPDALSATKAGALFLTALRASRAAPRRQPYGMAAGLALAATVGLGVALWIFYKAPRISAPAYFDAAIRKTEKPKAKRIAGEGRDSFKLRTLTDGRKHPNDLRIAGKRRRRQRTYIAQRIHPVQTLKIVSEKRRLVALHGVEFGEKSDSHGYWRDSALVAARLVVGEIDAKPTTMRRLVVIVTGREAPHLNVEVTAASDHEFGFAKISAFAPAAPGSGFLNECTIRTDDENESTVTTKYQVIAGKPISRLTLETSQPADKPISFEKGTKP